MSTLDVGEFVSPSVRHTDPGLQDAVVEMKEGSVIGRINKDLSRSRSPSGRYQHEVESGAVHSRISRDGVDLGYRKELLASALS